MKEFMDIRRELYLEYIWIILLFFPTVTIMHRGIIRVLFLNMFYKHLNIRVRHIKAKYPTKSARKYCVKITSVNWIPEEDEIEFSFQILKGG
jgi:hypothetical protein